MALIKIKEVIGTSQQSFEDAINQAIQDECKQKNKVTGAKILSQNVVIKEGRIKEYKVNLKIAYQWEEDFKK